MHRTASTKSKCLPASQPQHKAGCHTVTGAAPRGVVPVAGMPGWKSASGATGSCSGGQRLYCSVRAVTCREGGNALSHQQQRCRGCIKALHQRTSTASGFPLHVTPAASILDQPLPPTARPCRESFLAGSDERTAAVPSGTVPGTCSSGKAQLKSAPQTAQPCAGRREFAPGAPRAGTPSKQRTWLRRAQKLELRGSNAAAATAAQQMHGVGLRATRIDILGVMDSWGGCAWARGAA